MQHIYGYVCHCEEASDEAIPTTDMDICSVNPDCFVGSLLAMTEAMQRLAMTEAMQRLAMTDTLSFVHGSSSGVFQPRSDPILCCRSYQVARIKARLS